MGRWRCRNSRWSPTRSTLSSPTSTPSRSERERRVHRGGCRNGIAGRKRRLMGKLDGRIAVVTGAAAGLGRGIALLYAAEGANVAIVDKNAEGAERVADAVAGKGRRSLAIGADVGEEEAVERAFARIGESLGAPHVLVNNAG